LSFARRHHSLNQFVGLWGLSLGATAGPHPISSLSPTSCLLLLNKHYVLVAERCALRVKCPTLKAGPLSFRLSVESHLRHSLLSGPPSAEIFSVCFVCAPGSRLLRFERARLPHRLFKSARPPIHRQPFDFAVPSSARLLFLQTFFN